MKTMTNRAFGGLLSGFVFGLGLAVSQMTNPEKILSFLTIAPGWDASLLLVMAGALAVTAIGYHVLKPREPLFDTRFHLADTTRAIDARLLIGAAFFGLGWGIAGYCPGPAITALASTLVDPLIFVVAFLAGSQVVALLEAPDKQDRSGRAI